MKRNYHMDLSRRGSVWCCCCCGAEHEDVNQLRRTECSYEYPVCEYCGGCEESNECKPDCSGIAAALGQLDVHIAGHFDRD